MGRDRLALKKTLPMDAVTTLDVCDKSVYPVIHRLLQILAIQPVSTASGEKSSSCQRRQKQWMKSTISQEKLSGLASMAIKNRVRPKDVEKGLNKFAQNKKKASGSLV